MHTCHAKETGGVLPWLRMRKTSGVTQSAGRATKIRNGITLSSDERAARCYRSTSALMHHSQCKGLVRGCQREEVLWARCLRVSWAWQRRQQAESRRTTKAGPAQTAGWAAGGQHMQGHWRLSAAGQGQWTAANNCLPLRWHDRQACVSTYCVQEVRVLDQEHKMGAAQALSDSHFLCCAMLHWQCNIAQTQQCKTYPWVGYIFQGHNPPCRLSSPRGDQSPRGAPDQPGAYARGCTPTCMTHP